MSTLNTARPAMRLLLKPKLASHLPPPSLLPSLLPPPQSSLFSSTPCTLRRTRDNNPDRGVSTQRRTGPRQPLSVSKTEIPKPVLDKAKRSKPEVDPNHGLWDFFHSKDKPMNTPEEDDAHGRPWIVEELRGKSWEDLHGLWWVCAKERNCIATEAHERERLNAGYGEFEAKDRDTAVRRTQRAIKHVLTERYYAWREAEAVAKDDPEIDLSGNGPLYNPSNFIDEDAPEPQEQHMEHEERMVKALPDVPPEGKPVSRPNA